MLRKITHIIISLVLLVSTTGITIDKHYCGSRLVSVSIAGDSEPCCDTGDACCHDDVDTYKLAVDYTVSTVSIDFDQPAVDIPVRPLFYVSLPDGSLPDVEFTFFVPPSDYFISFDFLDSCS